jgi:hypothetical protein
MSDNPDSDEARLARHRDLHRTVPREVSEARQAEARQAATPAPAEPVRVYLVATGLTNEGRELYERHDVRPPLCDAETLYAAPPATPAPAGWKFVLVNDQFDALMSALDRAARKGYMPDAVADEWQAFDYDDAPATPAAQPAEWTITAPDGRQWTGATREPPTPEQQAAFEALVQKQEADMLADHEHLNCPACGGSGHVEDARDGWIAVADRLPEEDVDVLCARAHGATPVVAGLYFGAWYAEDTEDRIEHVTHWRPLPAAPEGSQG